MLTDACQFLRTLYGSELPTGTCLLIWTLPDHHSHWCKTLAEAESTLARLRDVPRLNTYLAIGLRDTDFGPSKRGGNTDVVSIPGVWADFDIAGPAHKKKNLPPSRQAILDLVSEWGAPPTISVNSGNGLQMYWAFDHPWIFDGPDAQERAATCVRRWNNSLRLLAKSRGWDVDSTHDLARVFRMPGTMNRKEGVPETQVHLLVSDGPRYTIEQLEERFIDDDRNSPTLRRKGLNDYTDVIVAEDITLDQAAEVSTDIIDALCENDPKFRLSWERKRKDLQDQSGSSYDMSIATMAANAGLSDQTIVNLLINHRRKHKDDLKLRLDYYRNTLFVAKSGLAKQRAIEQMEAVLNGGEIDAQTIRKIEESSEEPLTEDQVQRLALLKLCSENLEINITRLVRYVSSQSTYVLETSLGRITLGSIDGLVNQNKFRLAVLDLLGKNIPRFKQATWDKISESLRGACEDCDVGMEGTEDGQMSSWLELYLEAQIPSLSKDAMHARAPFVHGGSTYIFLDSFQRWVNQYYGESVKDMATKLRMCGATPETMGCTTRDGKATTRSVWKLPAARENVVDSE